MSAEMFCERAGLATTKGKNKPVPLLTGIHHINAPASDPLASSDWYARVVGFATVLIEERENDVVAALLEHPCGARLLLQRTPTAAIACGGHPLFGLAVPTHAELLRWVEHLTALGIDHSAVHQVHLGWAVTVTGPDSIPIQLQTDEGPSGEE